VTKEKGFITFTPGVDVPAGKQLGLQAERNQRLEQKILPLSLNLASIMIFKNHQYICR
jgi:hypothetical protein